MPKRTPKPKDIVARSISIKDSKGNTRIYMAALDEPSYASICLFGPRERAMELSADHEGGLHMSLRDGSGKIVASLGISADDHVGVSLCDHRIGARTELGSGWVDGKHSISVFHGGKLKWTTEKKTRRKS